MTMQGIDISNWQKGLIPSSLSIDFCIAKATEGLGFVDAQCNGFIQDCISNSIPFGYYHFARSNDPREEARFFYNNTSNYSGHGIPVLDYEVWGENNDVAFCEAFLDQYHALTGIWPLLYISASHCDDFSSSWIPSKCGLWVAGYPAPVESFDAAGNMPYSIAPWSICAIWQFTSSLKLPTYAGRLDGNIAYMDHEAWAKYAGSGDPSTLPTPEAPQSPDYDLLASEVWAGKWGNGAERQQALDSTFGAGTYDRVQKIVNGQAVDYNKLATEVIRGNWGNGAGRKQALDGEYGAGTYDKVQKIVNERLK